MLQYSAEIESNMYFFNIKSEDNLELPNVRLAWSILCVVCLASHDVLH